MPAKKKSNRTSVVDALSQELEKQAKAAAVEPVKKDESPAKVETVDTVSQPRPQFNVSITPEAHDVALANIAEYYTKRRTKCTMSRLISVALLLLNESSDEKIFETFEIVRKQDGRGNRKVRKGNE